MGSPRGCRGWVAPGDVEGELPSPGMWRVTSSFPWGDGEGVWLLGEGRVGGNRGVGFAAEVWEGGWPGFWRNDGRGLGGWASGILEIW